MPVKERQVSLDGTETFLQSNGTIFTVSEFFGPDTSNRLIANYLQSGGSDLFIQGILTIT